jgi:hypothetical protein
MTVCLSTVYKLTKHGVPFKTQHNSDPKRIQIHGADAGCGVTLDVLNRSMQIMSSVFRDLSLSVQFGNLITLSDGLAEIHRLRYGLSTYIRYYLVGYH